MAIDNYENLGFQVKIDGADTVETHLGKIVKRLKQIQKLNKVLGNIGKSASKGIGGGSSTSSKLTDEEKWEKQYQDKMRKQAYYLKQGYVQQRNIISDHTKWVLAEEKKLEKKRFLTEQGYIQEKPKLTEEEQFRNSFEKSKRRREFGIQEGYIQEKQNLSEIEKYLQKVNHQKDLLNSKTYEEARRIELANQQRKKEIDQRLKQELGIKQTTKSLTAYLAKLSSGIMIARRLGRFISSAIQESANYVENLNLFAVAYGDVYQETLGWALDLADGFGLASNEVLKFAGTFRQLSTSLGLVEDTANSVSKTVTQLGYDISALFNTSVENAMEKLQSGLFSGNVRPLRAYGIDISQNQIDALFETNEVLAQLGVNARNLSQSDKVLARLIITLRDGSNAFGTMNREINTLQSQIRVLQGSFSNFKLAIGDLVQEPIRVTLTYLNAFIIAMTSVVRAFHPLQTEDENAFTGVAMGAEEANEAIDELNGKLADFDKFNVLGGQSQSGGNLAVTEALTAELEKQQKLYQEQVDAMSKIKNEAVEMSKGVIGWFIEVDEEGNILYKDDMPIWTNNAKALGAGLTTLAGIMSLKLADSIIGLVKNIFTLKNATALLNTTLVAGAIFAFVKMVEAIKEGDVGIAILSGTIGVTLVGALILLELRKKSLAKATEYATWAQAAENANLKQYNLEMKQVNATIASSRAAFAMLGIGISAATLGLTSFISEWDNMGNAQKAVGIVTALAGAVTALAIATHGFKGDWVKAAGIAAMVAGGALFVTSKLPKFADGGYTNANLIMMNENGKREWVGKAAGSSAIVNDTQMSDIMEVAVAKGVYNALSARSAMGGNVPTNETIVVKIGEEAVFNAVRKTARRQGRDFANV